ncbi:MAG: PAS domain-containing protein [Planctomycetota bacterium]
MKPPAQSATVENEAEENLRRTLMNLPIPVLCGSNGETPLITLVNRAFTTAFGYTHEDIPTVERWLELAYPDPAYRAKVLAAWLAGLETGRRDPDAVGRDTVHVQAKDGTVRDIIFRATLLPSGPVCTLQDITDLERYTRLLAEARAEAEAEATLRQRMTLAARAAKSAFWEWNLSTDTITWSAEMMDVFGVSETERHNEPMLWKLWQARVHPQDWTAAEAHAMKARETQSPINMEYRIILSDGEVRWIESRGDVLRETTAGPVRIAGISIDVTDRKLAEQTAATYREQLEQLLAERTSELDAAKRALERTAYELTENIPAGTFVMIQPPGASLGHFSFASNRFLELLGLTREAAEQDPLNVFARVHPDDHDEYLRKNIAVFERRIPLSEEFRTIIGGETRWLNAASNPRTLPDGSTVWEGVLTDITVEKEAALREKHREENHRRELGNKLRTSLNAAALAHEINQPLSRILLRARLDLEKENSAGRETLQALIDDAERVIATIEKMRVLLRNIETAQQPIDVAQVVRSALLQLKQPLRAGRIEVSHTGPRESCHILGDDVQLQMVMVNLVRNAIEAIEAIGESDGPRREISIELVPHEDTIDIVIGDSGLGWPGGTIDDVLLRTTKPEGSGIGLYVVKTALDNHGGRIAIGSSPLGGAEFRITLPRAARGVPSASVGPQG